MKSGNLRNRAGEVKVHKATREKLVDFANMDPNEGELLATQVVCALFSAEKKTKKRWKAMMLLFWSPPLILMAVAHCQLTDFS